MCAKLGECCLKVRALGHEDAPAGEVRDHNAEDVLGASVVLHAIEGAGPLHDLDRFVIIIGVQNSGGVVNVQRKVDATTACKEEDMGICVGIVARVMVDKDDKVLVHK